MSFTEKPGNREHLERSDDCPKTVRPRLAAGSGSSSLSDWAQKKIADMILRRQLAGGESVVEGRLAEELTVSRTPMREALLRLEGEGLLVKQTGRSYTVRKVSPSEFFQSMRVREIVEQEAISLSLKNIPKQSLLDIKETIDKLISTGGVVEDFWDADNSVHEIFCTHSGNVVLSNIVRKLRVTTRLLSPATHSDVAKKIAPNIWKL
nr:GntR family transcriptional regulator [Halomonas socia]